MLTVLLVTPFLLFPSRTRALTVVAVAIVWVVMWLRTGELLPPTPLNLPILLLMVMVSVSVWATPDLDFSLGKISGVLIGVASFYAIVRWARSRDDAAIGLVVLALMGGALAAIGLAGTNWFEKFSTIAGVTRVLPGVIRGVPGAEEGFHPNPVGGMLVLFLPLQIAVVRQMTAGSELFRSLPRLVPPRLLLAALALAAGLSAVVLVLTQSRGAWAALAVAAGLSLYAYGPRQRRAALILTAVAVVSVGAIGPRRLFEAVTTPISTKMGTVEDRVELWSRATYVIADAPLTGAGMNMFRRLKPVRSPTYPRISDFDVAHAHNQLLHVATDIGLPGLVAYLAIWLLLAQMLLATFRNDRELRPFAIAIGTGLLAHFGFGLLDAVPLGAKPGILFWWMVALTVILHEVATARSSASSLQPSKTVITAGVGPLA